MDGGLLALQYSGQHGHCGAAVVWPVGAFFKDAGTADVIARQLVQLGLSSFALQDPRLGRPREQPGEDAHACCCAVALLGYTALYTFSGHA